MTQQVRMPADPSRVDPEMARALGKEGALFVRAVRERLASPGAPVRTYDGLEWLGLSFMQWQMAFPLWGARTLHRVIIQLEASGVLLARAFPEIGPYTTWYAIDPVALERLLHGPVLAKTSTVRKGTIA